MQLEGPVKKDSPIELIKFRNDFNNILNSLSPSNGLINNTIIKEKTKGQLPSLPCIEEKEIIKWSNCELKNKVINQIDKIFNDTSDSVITPIENKIHNKSLINNNNLNNKIKNLASELKNNINLSDFSTVKLKGIYFAKFSESIHKDIDSGINFTNANTILNKSIKELDLILPELENNKEDITKRISQIQFPFGNLPLGLDER